VNLRQYAGELWPYKIPSFIAGIAMKKLFKANELTRRIMLLHNDISDILYGCACLYDAGQSLKVKTPLFSSKYKLITAGK
jgi:2-dehydropantoate 2-reductase